MAQVWIDTTNVKTHNRPEIVDMAMQQLAAAPPKVMGQRPELKFVNEQGLCVYLCVVSVSLCVCSLYQSRAICPRASFCDFFFLLSTG